MNAQPWVNATHAVAVALVDEWARCGVEVAVVCPGSRSTPLALALWQDGRIRVMTHLDERSAAFFGLGVGRMTGRPAVVLATSGTAAANFLPAVEEARQGRVPLLVVTADRPPELRDTGALQTIDQVHLFGRAAKWFVELPVPEVREDVMRRVRTLAARAFAESLAVPGGPVHVNAPLREPLVPEAVPGERTPTDLERVSPAFAGRSDGRPFLTLHQVEAAGRLGRAVRRPTALTPERRGVILVGPLSPAYTCGPDPARAVRAALHLGEALGWPVFADALSGGRTGTVQLKGQVLTAYDAVARAMQGEDGTRLAALLAPEVVVQLGAVPVSKATAALAARAPERILIAEGTARDLVDPEQTATEALCGDPAAVCEALADTIPAAGGAGAWRKRWQEADALARAVLAEGLAAMTAPQGPLFEGAVAARLAARLPAGSTWLVGNSMPVRDVDSFVLAGVNAPTGVRVLANRGTSGIDGVVSTALGAASRAPEGTPTALLIGDLSFLHDANGLIAARLNELSLLAVVLDNGGGGIFSFLPQARLDAATFEPLFGVPVGMELASVVEAVGGRVHRVASWTAWEEALSTAVGARGLHVVIVRTPSRTENVRLHEMLFSRVATALKAWATEAEERPTEARVPGEVVG